MNSRHFIIHKTEKQVSTKRTTHFIKVEADKTKIESKPNEIRSNSFISKMFCKICCDAGKTKEEVEKIILTNSFSDLEASLKLKDWKKI